MGKARVPSRLKTEKKETEKKNAPVVVIIGGNFAGLAAARTLNTRRYRVVLIDGQPCFEWVPGFHELVSGVKSARDLRIPRAPLLDSLGVEFLQDRVLSIKPDSKQLSLESGGKLTYDYCLMATGVASASSGVPGADHHACGLRTVEEVSRMVNDLSRLEQTRDDVRVTLVGGGYTGIEVAGELLRRKPHRAQVHLRLVTQAERLCPSGPVSLDPRIDALTRDSNLEVLRRARVVSVSNDAVELADGRSLPSDLTLWMAGGEPVDMIGTSGLALRNGWIAVNRHLQSTSHAHVFAAGDNAAPKLAQQHQAFHALDMGRVAAQNLMAVHEKKALITYRPSIKPVLVSFGELDAFLLKGGLGVASPALAMGKEVIFDLIMTQLRSGRGLLDWPVSVGMLGNSLRDVFLPGLAPRMIRRNLSQGLQLLS